MHHYLSGESSGPHHAASDRGNEGAFLRQALVSAEKGVRQSEVYAQSQIIDP